MTNDFENQYEEYKKSILQNWWLIKTLREKYRGSITAEGDYIDRNGVLWKIGALSAVCGFCIALTFALENSGLWVLGIVLFIAIIGSVIWARTIEEKFKKDSGEVIFYTFRYHQHFKDFIQDEKDKETKKLLDDMLRTYEYSRFRDNIDSLTTEDLEEFIARVIRDTDKFKKRYQELSKYECLAGRLKDDYYFNAEIQKDIDKYT